MSLEVYYPQDILNALKAAAQSNGQALQAISGQSEFAEGYEMGYRAALNTWPLHKGILGRVARTGESALVKDVSQDPDYVEVAGDIRSQLSVPILRKGEVIGVINLESQDADAFAEADLDFIQRLADHIATQSVKNGGPQHTGRWLPSSPQSTTG